MTPWRPRHWREPRTRSATSDALWAGGIAMPPEPRDLVEFIAAELGSEPAKGLVRYVFNVVERTGQPDAWIREVSSARTRGTLSPSVANFLIYQLAEWATVPLSGTHPLLSQLEARMEAIEREHGLKKGEYFLLNEAPVEWRAVNRVWEAVVDELMTEIFLRNGEREIAEAYAATQQGLYEEGRVLLFGDGA